MTKKKILYVVLYLILLNGLIQTYLLKSEFIKIFMQYVLKISNL